MGHSVTSSTHCPFCALQCGMHLTGTADSVHVAGNARFPRQQGRPLRQGLARGRDAGASGPPDNAARPRCWRYAAAVYVDRALDLIARRVGDVQTAHGRDAIGVFGSGALTNEKAYLLGKFARVALQTSNVDYNGRFCTSSGAAASVRASGSIAGCPSRSRTSRAPARSCSPAAIPARRCRC